MDDERTFTFQFCNFFKNPYLIACVMCILKLRVVHIVRIKDI